MTLAMHMKADRSGFRLSWPFIILFVSMAWLASPAFAQETPAYQERIATPHVVWSDDVQASVRVLCLVNYLAGREPAELAQRFPFMDIHAVPVSGNAYKNNFDETFLTRALEEDQYDVIVVAASRIWRDLSDEAAEALRKRVAGGTPMVIFGRSPELPSTWGEKNDWQPHDELMHRITSLLPARDLPFRGRFGVQRMSLGHGVIFHFNGFDQAFVHFNAFVARAIPFEGKPITPEVYYAIAAEAIRTAAQMPSLAVHDVRLTPEAGGRTARLRMMLAQEAPQGSELRWSFWSPFSQSLAAGTGPIESGAGELNVVLPLPRHGAQFLVWRIVHGSSLLALGAMDVPASGKASLGEVTLPEWVKPSEAVAVKWSLRGSAAASLLVESQIYDPDGRLVSWSREPAVKGTLSCAGWAAGSFSVYEMRVLLLDGSRVLDEQRLPVHVRLDRQDDLDRFHVVVWGTEQGAWVERSRYHLLRHLGINAFAPIGIRKAASCMASEQGLRLVPTNVYVPPNRFTNMERYSREQSEQRLADYAAAIAQYTPLGYSLADEPNTKDYVAWRDRGAQIVHEFDPGAPVGFCGVKLGSSDDLPGFFKGIDFLEMYSPLHLYTPDLWLGVERDKFRSFRRDDAIVTSWTHYAPKRDHEPYSRTVPWLWLFDQMDGVSYFDSAGSFAILNPDLTTTHETRWWREEVLRLRQGIAEQILSMNRDDGEVRIVLLPHAQGEDVWARALNQMGIPYRFTTAAELAGDDEAKLTIWPHSTQVPPEAAAAMTAFVHRGGNVIAILPLKMADVSDAVGAAEQALGKVLGLEQTAASPLTDQVLARQRGIPAVVAPNASGQASLTGRTTGQSGVRPVEAMVQSRFMKLGVANRDEASGHPPFIQHLFETPAMLRRQAGEAIVSTLLFEPDLETAKSLLREHGADVNRPQLLSGQFKAPIYSYHLLGESGVQMLGYVADYWRAGPDLAIEGGEQTVGYFHHGPHRWLTREAQLTLPAPRHVYDVRRGEYLGQGDRFTLQIDPARPGLLSMLPYRVDQLDIDVPASLAAGQTLTGKLRLLLSDASSPMGMHVIHLQLQPPTNGGQGIPETADVHVRGVEGRFSMALPHNAVPGQWTLRATDVLTGVSASHVVIIHAAGEKPSDVLAAALPTVWHEPLDWPQGRWVDVGEAQEAQGVKVSVRPLERKRQHSLSGFQGDWAVTGNFRLTNPDISYQLRYFASNDHEKRGWNDERRIGAPYLPGLGFRDPQPHMWYVNGYLNVYFDDVCVTKYRLSRIEKIEEGKRGRVEVTWDTPYGKIDLAFVLFADDIAMFQEMVIHPTVAFNTLELRFRSYPAGFGQGARGTRMLREVNEDAGWALLGNRDLDPAYNKGMGSGAMLILPEHWTKAAFGRGMVGASLKRVIDPDATPLKKDFVPSRDDIGQQPPIQARWALWMFPKMGNAEALQYMDVTADDARRRLIELYPNQNK